MRPYWPDGVIFIHKSNEEEPDQPLIFVIPSSTRPIDNPNINRSLLIHNTRSEAIQAVNILGPNYRWPKISKPKEVNLSNADELKMKITVDGIVPNNILLNDLVSIS